MSLPFRLSAFPPVGWCALAAALAGAMLSASGAAQTPSQTAPQIVPYTARLIAGGGKVTTFTAGQTCPSGAPNTAKDAFGDGCLATDIVLSGPRYAIADADGNVFFSDYTNGLVRRVDVTSGVVTAVAGGASANPSTGASCGTGSTATATDILGDGCLATQVKLVNPSGLAFDASGNLYFADPGKGSYSVRKVAATNGFVTTSGIISLIDGDTGGTKIAFGYGANNGSLTSCSTPGSTCITANMQGYLNGPYDLTVDPKGNVLIADEFANAVLAVNPTAVLQTIGTISIPAGTIGKLVGAQTGNNPICTNGSAGSTGCRFGTFVNGASASASLVDSPWSVALDASGNLYIANEFNENIAQVDTTGDIHNYAGIQGSIGKNLANTIRNTAGSFATGASLGVAADAQGNIYVPDETNGLLWRVDGATSATGGNGAGTGHLQYVVAGGGAATAIGAPCSAGSTAVATDTLGDGCPAKLAKFGANGNFGSNSSLGIYGVKVDANSNLYVGDASNKLVREIATGAQFGIVGSNQPTDTFDIHFAAGDNQIAPVTASGVTTYPSFVLTSGATNFKLGTPTCTTNSDNTPANTVNPLTGNTTDCLLPVTATPSALGPFTGTLQVTSANGGVASFPLSGDYAQSPNTRTTVSYASNSVACTGTTTYSNTTPITITATVIANGPNPPTASADTVTFFANDGSTTIQLGQPVQVANTGSSSSPIYTATTTYTFANTGTYTLTAVYSGDSYFKTSTGASPATLTSATPGYMLSPVANQQNTVTAGQAALFSFNVNQSVYTGTISFAVSGLPANSSYTLSSTSITATGCSVVNTIALTVNTQAQQTVQPAGVFGSSGGRIPLLFGALQLALLGFFTLKRSRRLSHLFLLFAGLLAGSSTLGCGKAAGTVLQPATPSGNYTITVTPTSSTGTAAPITFTMTVK